MRKDYGKNNRCPYCGKYFNYLGIARHRTACWEKKKQRLEAEKGKDEKWRQAMKAEELIKEINKLGTVPWEDDDRVLLIPKDAVLLIIQKFLADLDSLLKEKLSGDSWVLEELIQWLKAPPTRAYLWSGDVVLKIGKLESQAPLSDIAKEIEQNRKKAEAWKRLESYVYER